MFRWRGYGLEDLGVVLWGWMFDSQVEDISSLYIGISENIYGRVDISFWQRIYIVQVHARGSQLLTAGINLVRKKWSLQFVLSGTFPSWFLLFALYLYFRSIRRSIVEYFSKRNVPFLSGENEGEEEKSTSTWISMTVLGNGRDICRPGSQAIDPSLFVEQIEGISNAWSPIAPAFAVPLYRAFYSLFSETISRRWTSAHFIVKIIREANDTSLNVRPLEYSTGQFSQAILPKNISLYQMRYRAREK